MRMPRLIGMTRTQALLTLLKMHTAPRRIRPPDGDGTVLGQSPLPGEPLTVQTDITLDLASLPPPGSAGATMPKVVGLSVDEAVRRLGESRLKINSLQRMDTDAAQPGEIVAQKPSIGAAVTAGTPIDLYVAMPDRAKAGAARHGGFSAAPLALAPRATPAPVAPMGRGEPWPRWTLWAGLGSAGLALLAVAALMRGAGGRKKESVATSRDRGSSARWLRAADRAAVPWKNGGGVTREIAAWPAGSDLDTFDWRVSMATVESGGPFSTFPGIDRTLTVLEGELVLSIDGGKDLTFDPGSEPLTFSGEAAVVAKTPSTPVIDLNVMTRRGRASAKVVAWRGSAPPTLAPANWTLLCSRRDNLKVRAFGEAFDLSKDDALLITGRDTTGIEMASAGEFDLFLIFINA
jgi:environmental stress-induced protein Ves